MFAGDGAAGGEAEDEEVSEVREEEGGEGVVEVGVWVVGGAEGAVAEGGGPIGEVEAAGVEGCDAGF